MTTAHIGEDAALYALGMLEPAERDAVDQHVRSCEACSILLAQAYDDVAAMVAAAPQQTMPAAARRSRIPLSRFAALAAAILIALLPASYLYRENVATHEAMVAQNDAMDRIASSPHRVASFAGTNAQVMYGTDGTWYAVIVHGAKAPMHVAWMHDGTSTMLGTAVPHGDVAVLYLPKSHRMDQLALVQDDRIVGEARLVF